MEEGTPFFFLFFRPPILKDCAFIVTRYYPLTLSSSHSCRSHGFCCSSYSIHQQRSSDSPPPSASQLCCETQPRLFGMLHPPKESGLQVMPFSLAPLPSTAHSLALPKNSQRSLISFFLSCGNFDCFWSQRLVFCFTIPPFLPSTPLPPLKEFYRFLSVKASNSLLFFRVWGPFPALIYDPSPMFFRAFSPSI